MWPKALSQLIELAPHVSRLLPMADRFFQSKSAESDASRTALEQMAAGLRGDLGQVTASHAGLYHQLNELNGKLHEQSQQIDESSEKLSAVAASVQSMQTSVDSLETRLTRFEQQISTLRLFVGIALAFLIAICVLSALILVHQR